MPEQGGQNEIAALSIAVGVDASSVQPGLDAAVQNASKAGEDAGKAFVEGAAKGTGVAAGGLANHGLATLGYDTASSKNQGPREGIPGEDFATLGYNTKPGGADAGGGVASGLNSTAAAASLLIAQIDRFASIGKQIGDAFFEGTKQQLELTQAIRQLESTLLSQQKLNADKYAQQARGPGGRPAGSLVQERIDALEVENQGLDKQLGKDWTVGDVTQWGLTHTPWGQNVGTLATEREQKQEQKDENQNRLNSLYKQRTGLLGVGRQTTIGRAIGIAADSFGIEHAPFLGQVGESMGGAQFDALVRALESNRTATEMLAKSIGSFSGTQQLIRDITNSAKQENIR